MVRFAILIFFFLAATPGSAQACSCVQPDLIRSYREVTDVIRGRTVGSWVVGSNTYYAMRVKKVFKGCTTVDRIVYLTTPTSSATCGQELKVGKVYLITGDETPSSYTRPVFAFNICGFNKRPKHLTTDERAFLRGRPVECNGSFVECADGSSLVSCFVDPCQVSTCATANSVCEANYCGGCHAEFYDSSNNAACYPWP
jgi:hypothetical protein